MSDNDLIRRGDMEADVLRARPICVKDAYGLEKAVIDSWFEIMLEVVRNFPAVKQPMSANNLTWRDANKELPGDDEKVLCLTKTKKGDYNYVLGYYAADLARWVCGMNSNVKYWMALPMAPEEGGHE